MLIGGTNPGIKVTFGSSTGGVIQVLVMDVEGGGGSIRSRKVEFTGNIEGSQLI